MLYNWVFSSKQPKKPRSISQDESRFLRLFWIGKTQVLLPKKKAAHASQKDKYIAAISSQYFRFYLAFS